MASLIKDISYTLASGMPRRDAIKLILYGIAAVALPFSLPGRAYAAADCTACGPDTPVNCGNGSCCHKGEKCCVGKGTCECCNNKECCKDGKCQPQGGGRISSVRTGPPSEMDMAVWSALGIKTIAVYKTVNATVTIAPFNAGTTEPVVCTATKIDQKKPAVALMKVCPEASGIAAADDCCFVCDPILTTLQVPKGRERIRESFTEIPDAEHYVTIQNGHPGLRKLHVFVNGQRAAVLRVGPKGVQTADIAAAMTPGSQNIITLTGQGRPGASALVLISDVPGPEGTGAGSTYRPLVEWDSSTSAEGVNMRWGGGIAVM